MRERERGILENQTLSFSIAARFHGTNCYSSNYRANSIDAIDRDGNGRISEDSLHCLSLSFFWKFFSIIINKWSTWSKIFPEKIFSTTFRRAMGGGTEKGFSKDFISRSSSKRISSIDQKKKTKKKSVLICDCSSHCQTDLECEEKRKTFVFCVDDQNKSMKKRVFISDRSTTMFTIWSWEKDKFFCWSSVFVSFLNKSSIDLWSRWLTKSDNQEKKFVEEFFYWSERRFFVAQVTNVIHLNRFQDLKPSFER